MRTNRRQPVTTSRLTPQAQAEILAAVRPVAIRVRVR
jgi:hypothetical protein